MKSIIGWLKFNENKDAECKDCNETHCVCDKEEATDEEKNEAFDELESRYDSLSVEEKKELPDFIKKAIEKKKGKGKGKKKDDEGGDKPDFFKKKKK